jgi:lipopolysaccharide heptosyltransferase II
MRKLKPAQARIARAIDLLILPLHAMARGLRSRGAAAPPSTILVVELWRLGDLVLVTPALQSLRERYPDARISLLASPESMPLLSGQDVVDEFLPFSAPWIEHHYRILRWPWRALWREVRRLRKARFDVAVDFRGDFRDNLLMWLIGARRRIGFAFAGGGAFLTHVVAEGPDRHQADQALDAVAALGARRDGFGTKLWISDQEAREARRWLEKSGLAKDRGPLVALHPGARWEGRRWPSKRFADLADALARTDGARILLLGGPGDDDAIREIRGWMRTEAIVARPALRQLVALLAACDLFIGVDSGPMHIATAVGTPVIGLFGPQRPEWFGPYGAGHRIAIAEVPCRPCDQIVCSRPESSCMRLLESRAVLDLARARLRARGDAWGVSGERAAGGAPAPLRRSAG